MRTDRVAIISSALVAAFHLAFANRYDLFRDELYFIVCGRHPAFGYADQPPLVPFLAAALYAIGHETWIVRLPAVLASAALVWVVVAFVRLLGGRDGAAWIAAIAAGFAPILLGASATLNTTAFEPLAWTLVAYALARAALLDDRRALVWAGLAAGLAMEAKYSLPLWLAGLAFALAFFPERRLFRTREMWLGLALAFVLAVPSVIWQATHGLPFLELVRDARGKDVSVPPVAFALNQVLIMSPAFAPIWLCGFFAPFGLRDLRGVRFLPIAFAFAAVAIVEGGGKDYYLASAYPPLFALGGVAIERLVRSAALRTAYLGVAFAGTLALAPLALPILAPDALVAYQRMLHLTPQAQEQGDDADLVPPLFADMLGWHDFVREVGVAYDALPPAERARTAIVVDNYGEAAALDIYGAPYGLPPALSGHNQYFFWRLRGQHPLDVLRVQFHPDRMRPHCTELTRFGPTHSRYARDFENGRTIALCRDIHPSLETLWPTFEHII